MHPLRAGFPTELVDLTASLEEYGNASGIYAALQRGDVDIYPEARRPPGRSAQPLPTLLVSTLAGLTPEPTGLSPPYPAGVEVGGGDMVPSIRFCHEEKSSARTRASGHLVVRTDRSSQFIRRPHVACRRCADPTLGATGSDGAKRVRIAASLCRCRRWSLTE